ncbi:MAG TPA: TfoX/Sxy family protein [Longimicrobiaceae bacterium]|nr:TfoX/Sxy family protein [Longimicrobiaceae bacterium]
MAVSREFRDYVLEQLGRVAPVTSRAMFGGVGIYSEGVFFALMDDDLVYFKTDDTNRPDFERAGKGPFRPFGEEAKPMRYHELPGELLEDPDQLRPWMEKALAVARSARKRK